MATRLDKIDSGENQVAQKSATPLTSAVLTLATTYVDVLFGATPSAILVAGNNPCIGAVALWTPGATPALLTIRVLVSLDDGVTFAAPPYIPSATATGTTPAYPQIVTFAKADWGNVATVMNCGFTIRVPGFRTFKLQALSDSVTNAPVVTIQLGAGASA